MPIKTVYMGQLSNSGIIFGIQKLFKCCPTYTTFCLHIMATGLELSMR